MAAKLKKGEVKGPEATAMMDELMAAGVMRKANPTMQKSTTPSIKADLQSVAEGKIKGPLANTIIEEAQKTEILSQKPRTALAPNKDSSLSPTTAPARREPKSTQSRPAIVSTLSPRKLLIKDVEGIRTPGKNPRARRNAELRLEILRLLRGELDEAPTKALDILTEVKSNPTFNVILKDKVRLELESQFKAKLPPAPVEIGQNPQQQSVSSASTPTLENLSRSGSPFKPNNTVAETVIKRINALSLEKGDQKIRIKLCGLLDGSDKSIAEFPKSAVSLLNQAQKKRVSVN